MLGKLYMDNSRQVGDDPWPVLHDSQRGSIDTANNLETRCNIRKIITWAHLNIKRVVLGFNPFVDFRLCVLSLKLSKDRHYCSANCNFVIEVYQLYGVTMMSIAEALYEDLLLNVLFFFGMQFTARSKHQAMMPFAPALSPLTPRLPASSS
jgi:hypothetical protein